MAFVTPSSRSGSINYGADATALFLKVFSGEVLSVFEETNVMMPLHRVRTISSGKSAQFPVTGVASAAYHQPGESLFADEYDATGDGSLQGTYLSKPKHAEKIIFIDGVLQASAFLSQIDEAMNHYDVRSIYSTEIGRQLAYHADKACIRTVIAAARKTTDRFGSNYVGTPTSVDGSASPFLGNSIAVADATAGGLAGNQMYPDGFTQATLPTTPSGETIIAGLFTAARLMDEKNVPSQGRYCLLAPQLYYKLVNENKDAINRDYGNDGNGSVAQGEILSVAGIRIMKSNHLPRAGVSEATDPLLGSSLVKNDLFGDNSGYAGGVGENRGIIFQSEGIGTVKLLDLAVESEYFMERMGTLLMAKYAMGHGILREECCYELFAD